MHGALSRFVASFPFAALVYMDEAARRGKTRSRRLLKCLFMSIQLRIPECPMGPMELKNFDLKSSGSSQVQSRQIK